MFSWEFYIPSSKLLYITPGISCFCYIEWGTEKHHIHASVFPTWRDLFLNFELILPRDVIAQHPTVKNLLSSLDPLNRDSKLKITWPISLVQLAFSSNEPANSINLSIASPLSSFKIILNARFLYSLVFGTLTRSMSKVKHKKCIKMDLMFSGKGK